MRSADEVTESQWTWLQCQLALDDGVELCAACMQPGFGTYCQHCGGRMPQGGQPLFHCDTCSLKGAGPYCVHCGAPLMDETREALEAGTFDWQKLQQDLAPFLCGVSPREAALLQQQG